MLNCMALQIVCQRSDSERRPLRLTTRTWKALAGANRTETASGHAPTSPTQHPNAIITSVGRTVEPQMCDQPERRSDRPAVAGRPCT